MPSGDCPTISLPPGSNLKFEPQKASTDDEILSRHGDVIRLRPNKGTRDICEGPGQSCSAMAPDPSEGFLLLTRQWYVDGVARR